MLFYLLLLVCTEAEPKCLHLESYYGQFTTTSEGWGGDQDEIKSSTNYANYAAHLNQFTISPALSPDLCTFDKLEKCSCCVLATEHGLCLEKVFCTYLYRMGQTISTKYKFKKLQCIFCYLYMGKYIHVPLYEAYRYCCNISIPNFFYPFVELYNVLVCNQQVISTCRRLKYMQ